MVKSSTAVLSVFWLTARSVHPRMPRPIYLYHLVRMTDGGFWPLIPSGPDGGWGVGPSVPEQTNYIFARQWRAEEGQSDRIFQAHLPRNTTWTRGGDRHQGVNLDFQRRVVNCGSSRNLPTDKCKSTSGKSVGCGRPVSWKGNTSHAVMKPGISEPESGLSAQRNVLNERGRLYPEGTQEGASIPILFSTGNAQTSRYLYVCHALSDML